uniref:Uncharacterized protein n=1 Tax=Streptomyces fradiae TaxID=1906 RepID=Q4A4A2_STRFR|nr:hypothetical protein [Streptomyces fradiae ATCC 10745 = DSM 40063]
MPPVPEVPPRYDSVEPSRVAGASWPAVGRLPGAVALLAGDAVAGLEGAGAGEPEGAAPVLAEGDGDAEGRGVGVPVGVGAVVVGFVAASPGRGTGTGATVRVAREPFSSSGPPRRYVPAATAATATVPATTVPMPW